MSAEPPQGPLTPIGEVLRTPEARFAGLPDYAFAPHYATSRSHGALRIHYIDEGPRDAAETVLLLHGEPAWSYLYRHMIPPLAAAGHRVVAVDLVGFGRSDKPARAADYSYERHVDWLCDALVEAGVTGATLFGQDWGGLVGLRAVARLPERFSRIVLSNTGLPLGGGRRSKAFDRWLEQSQEVPDWSAVIAVGTQRAMGDAELEAYDAPFPTEAYKAGARAFPRLVPFLDAHDSVEENKGAMRRVFRRWRRPLLTLYSDKDPITRGGAAVWQREVPGAAGQAHAVMRGGGHFVQEDCAPQLVAAVLAFMRANPVAASAVAPAARL
jgi:haloalkane dehalogenase